MTETTESKTTPAKSPASATIPAHGLFGRPINPRDHDNTQERTTAAA